MGLFRTLLVKYALLSEACGIFLTNEQIIESPNSSAIISSSHSAFSSNSLENDDGGEQILPDLTSSPIPSLASQHSESEGELSPEQELSETSIIPKITSDSSADEHEVNFTTEKTIPLTNLPLSSNPSASEVEMEPTIKRKISPIIFKGSQLSKHKNPLQRYNVRGKTPFAPSLLSVNNSSNQIDKDLYLPNSEIIKKRTINLIRSLRTFFSYFEAGPHPLFLQENKVLHSCLKEFRFLKIQMGFMNFLTHKAAIPLVQIRRFIYDNVHYNKFWKLYNLYAEFKEEMRGFYELIELSKMTPKLFWDVLGVIHNYPQNRKKPPLINKMRKLCKKYLKVHLENKLTWDMMHDEKKNVLIPIPQYPAKDEEGYELMQYNFIYYAADGHALMFGNASFDILQNHIQRKIQVWDFEYSDGQCTSNIISRLFDNITLLPLQRIEILKAMIDQLDPKIPRSCYFKLPRDYDEAIAFVKEKASANPQLAEFHKRFVKALAEDNAESYGYARRMMQNEYKTTMKEVVKYTDHCPLQEIKNGIEEFVEDPEKLRENICPQLNKCSELSGYINTTGTSLFKVAIDHCPHKDFHSHSFARILSRCSFRNYSDYNREMFNVMIKYCIKLMDEGVNFDQCDLFKMQLKNPMNKLSFHNTNEGKKFAERTTLMHMKSLGFSIEALFDSPILAGYYYGRDSWAKDLMTNPQLFSHITKKKISKEQRWHIIGILLEKLSGLTKFEEYYLALLSRIRSYTKRYKERYACENLPKERVLHYELCVFAYARNEAHLFLQIDKRIIDKISDLEKQLNK